MNAHDNQNLKSKRGVRSGKERPSRVAFRDVEEENAVSATANVRCFRQAENCVTKNKRVN